MARQYGESFQRPIDPFTGLPYPGMPAMAVISNNRPSGPGVVYLRDEEDGTPPPAPRTGPGGPPDPSGN
jgi:hypothetical protein